MSTTDDHAIHLEKADFYELLARSRQVDILKFKVVQAMQAVKQEEQAYEAFGVELAKRYQFDPETVRLDEATQTLVPR